MALYGCEAYLPATPVLCCLQTHITTPAQEATARCLLGGSNSLMRSEDTLFTHTQSLSLSGPLLQTSVSHGTIVVEGVAGPARVGGDLPTSLQLRSTACCSLGRWNSSKPTAGGPIAPESVYLAETEAVLSQTLPTARHEGRKPGGQGQPDPRMSMGSPSVGSPGPAYLMQGRSSTVTVRQVPRIY